MEQKIDKRPQWDWLPCNYNLKTQGNKKSTTWNLQPAIVLSNPINPESDPMLRILIDTEKILQYQEGIGWNWHKSWNLPNISVKIEVLDKASNEPLLCPKDLVARIFTVKAAIEEPDYFHLVDVGIRGNYIQPMNNGQAFFTTIKFNSTSYNNEGAKFHLLMVIHQENDGESAPKILNACISPPIFVDSRNCGGFQAVVPEKRMNSFVQPFHPEQFDREYIKRENKKKSDVQISINNDLDGLYNFLTAPNIRHKAKHPIFLILKFSSVCKLYFNNDFINFKSFKDLLEIVQRTLSKEHSQISCSENEQSNLLSTNNNNNPLQLEQKSFLLYVQESEINTQTKRIKETMEPLNCASIQVVYKQSNIPSNFQNVLGENIEVAEELKKEYISNFQSLTDIASETTNSSENDNNDNEDQEQQNMDQNNGYSNNILSSNHRRPSKSNSYTRTNKRIKLNPIFEQNLSNNNSISHMKQPTTYQSRQRLESTDKEEQHSFLQIYPKNYFKNDYYILSPKHQTEKSVQSSKQSQKLQQNEQSKPQNVFQNQQQQQSKYRSTDQEQNFQPQQQQINNYQNNLQLIQMKNYLSQQPNFSENKQNQQQNLFMQQLSQVNPQSLFQNQFKQDNPICSNQDQNITVYNRFFMNNLNPYIQLKQEQEILEKMQGQQTPFYPGPSFNLPFLNMQNNGSMENIWKYSQEQIYLMNQMLMSQLAHQKQIISYMGEGMMQNIQNYQKTFENNPTQDNNIMKGTTMFGNWLNSFNLNSNFGNSNLGLNIPSQNNMNNQKEQQFNQNQQSQQNNFNQIGFQTNLNLQKNYSGSPVNIKPSVINKNSEKKQMSYPQQIIPNHSNNIIVAQNNLNLTNMHESSSNRGDDDKKNFNQLIDQQKDLQISSDKAPEFQNYQFSEIQNNGSNGSNNNDLPKNSSNSLLNNSLSTTNPHNLLNQSKTNYLQFLNNEKQQNQAFQNYVFPNEQLTHSQSNSFYQPQQKQNDNTSNQNVSSNEKMQIQSENNQSNELSQQQE